MKACTKCTVVKDLIGFSPRKNSKDKYDYWCKACRCSAVKAWKQTNPDAVKKQAHRRYVKLRNAK